MFAISHERKGRFVVSKDKHLVNFTHDSTASTNANNLMIKTQVGGSEKAIMSHKDINNTSIFFHTSPATSSITPIRFTLSKEVPAKKRKTKKQKKLKIKKKRNREETYSIGRWKYDEHQRFVEALIKYGNDWKQVQKSVKTRSSTQARSHAQKFFVKIQKAKLLKFNLDLSKKSIKMLHDLVNSLSKEDYKKLLKAFNAVAFERNKQSKKRFRNYSFNQPEDISSINSNWFQEDNNDLPNKNDDILTIGRKRRRKSSIEKEPYQTQRKRRMLESINSIEGFFNTFIEDNEIRAFHRESFDDKDYALSFNNAFNIEPLYAPWRKISQDEEFRF